MDADWYIDPLKGAGSPDGGTDGGTDPGPADGGCGCASAGDKTAAPVFLLLLCGLCLAIRNRTS
jgi:MYXO-CTERM domain-containing protein